MTEEQIEILKQLESGNIHRIDISEVLSEILSWQLVDDNLKSLSKNGYADRDLNLHAAWQITPTGMAAIKKWDREGAQVELFEK